MICSKCGTNIAEGMAFCPGCGSPAAPSTPVAPNAQGANIAPDAQAAPVNQAAPVTPAAPVNPAVPNVQGAPMNPNMQAAPMNQGAPVAPAPKKSKVPMIIGISVAAVLILLVVFLGYCYKLGSDIEKFDTAIKLGYQNIEDDEYKKAVDNFKTAIEISPDKPDGYIGLINAYTFLDDYDKIVHTYNQARHNLTDEQMDDLGMLVVEELQDLLRISIAYGDLDRAEDIADEIEAFDTKAYNRAISDIEEAREEMYYYTSDPVYPDPEEPEPFEYIYQPSDQEVVDAFYEARDIYDAAMFGGNSTDLLPLGEYTNFEDLNYAGYPVLNVDSLDEVVDLLSTVFSEDIAYYIVDKGGFMEIDGIVYKACYGVGGDISKGDEYIDNIERISDTEIIIDYSVESLEWDDATSDWYFSHYIYVEFSYEYIDGYWVFTNFFEPYVDMPSYYY